MYEISSMEVWNPRSVALYCKDQQGILSFKCMKIFKYAMTSEGICVSYNSLSISEIFVENNYKKMISNVFEVDDSLKR